MGSQILCLAMEYLFLCTGGTIDKHYPRTMGGYSFEFGPPAVESIMQRIRPEPAFTFRVLSVCKEDSQDMTDYQRLLVVEAIASSSSSKVIITHGTDTLIETALFIAERRDKIVGKVIVLTGAFLPEKFKDSDADFNLGVAVGSASLLPEGVYVAMNGQVTECKFVERSPETGTFKQKARK